ncbi:MAG: cobalt-precorrin 5A hydrolase [Muricomes sp.]
MGNKIAIFSFTEAGSKQNSRVSKMLLQRGYACESYTIERFAEQFAIQPLPANLKQWIGQHWGEYSFVFVGAAGIAIRHIAPWVADKYTDSAVLCTDEKGRYVIPLLSGHVGGAVELSGVLAGELGAENVITTATDLQNKFAVDVFARDNHLHIASRKLAKEISAAVLRDERVGLYSSFPVEGQVPDELYICHDFKELCGQSLGIAVVDDSIKDPSGDESILYLIPKNLVIGVGCRRGVGKEALKQRLEKFLETVDASANQIEAFVSIDLKQNEIGILELAKEYKVPFITYSAEELQKVEGVSVPSEFVQQITGVDNVCERAAKKYAPKGKMIQEKVKMDGVTYAAVRNVIKLEF